MKKQNASQQTTYNPNITTKNNNTKMATKKETPNVANETNQGAGQEGKLGIIEVVSNPRYHYDFYRIEISSRPNLTPELIEVLSKDDSRAVRFNIALRDDLTAEQVDRLSKDEDWSVRWAIARNPHAQEILNSK